MIRNLLATTALATLVSTGVYAQDATQPAQPAAPRSPTGDCHAIQPPNLATFYWLLTGS